MENTRIALLIDLLNQARTQTVATANGIPESHRFKQLAPGKATPTWLLGHLARSADRILIEWTLEHWSVVGERVGEKFAPAHAGGIAPTTNPDDYPQWDSILAMYETVMGNAVEGLAALADADLEKPLPAFLPPEYRDRFPNIGAAIKMVISHDAYHRGQMGLLGKLA